MSFVISLSSERHTISVKQYEEENNSLDQQSVSENSKNDSNSNKSNENTNINTKSYHDASSFNTGIVITLEDTEDIY